MIFWVQSGTEKRIKDLTTDPNLYHKQTALPQAAVRRKSTAARPAL